jgi:hypothetical protein
MAVGFYFAADSMTPEQYHSVLSGLEAAGQSAPAGRLYHCALRQAGSDALHIFDIWESPEAFAAFGATLVPLLFEAGLEPIQPRVSEIHNVIAG